jgi:hypothetical protein
VYSFRVRVFYFFFKYYFVLRDGGFAAFFLGLSLFFLSCLDSLLGERQAQHVNDSRQKGGNETNNRHMSTDEFV